MNLEPPFAVEDLQSMFQPLIGKLLDMQWGGQMENGVRVFTTHNYRIALLVIPIGLLVSFLLTFLVKETHCRLRDS